MHLLALLKLITDLNDRFSYPCTSTSEIYPFIYLNPEKRTSFGRYLTGNFTPSILKSTSWVNLSWWKFINTFVGLFQSRARNQALAKSTEMFRVSTVWVLKPAIMLQKAFFSFWHLYSKQGRTAWLQVTVTHAPYFSGTEVVKFLIDMCNTWRYLLLLLLIINRPWPVHSFEWKLPTQEKRTFAKHWKQICQTSSSAKVKGVLGDSPLPPLCLACSSCRKGVRPFVHGSLLLR